VGVSGRGYIDFHGHVSDVACYILGGWVSEDLSDTVRDGLLTLVFEDGELDGLACGAVYPRPGLGGLGTGILICVPADQPRRGRLQAVRLGSEAEGVSITPSTEGIAVDQETLLEMLAPILPHVARSLPRSVVRGLAPDLMVIRGAIDLVGVADGITVISGWAPIGRMDERQVEASWVRRGQVTPIPATMTLYGREGLEPPRVGLVLIMPAPVGGRASGKDIAGSVQFGLDGDTVVLTPTPEMTFLDGERLRDAVRPLLPQLDRGPAHDRLTRLAAPRSYRGGNTLDTLSDAVRLEIDAAIHCPPDGLVLLGWMLAGPGTVESLWLHSGHSTSRIEPERWISIARGGGVEEVGRELGLVDPRCGFIALIPEGYDRDALTYLEVRTHRGEVAYRDIPARRLSGRNAIETLLEGCDFQYADLAPAFDHVLGPAIRRLNQDRLARAPVTTTIRFGTPHPAPRCSVIVPLYRRLDHMDFQVGLLAADPAGQDVELIYVLDDPPLRREAENLAALLHARFDLPITLICLGENLGFAPACNIGLRAARGNFVCLLNSDVFPQGPGWLDRLCAALDDDPTLGVVGPMLLYEDGSVQHRGMSFRRLPQFGDWFFGDHPGKGLKPEPDGGLERCISITGACMVLRRDLALRLGGFDEGFIIGDFEDSDLCLRIQGLGLACAVDLSVRLFHLERKSQASSALRWRMNLTVYNAWFHQQRWGTDLSRLMAPDPV
jgi:GT2 family glycosyltransferase